MRKRRYEILLPIRFNDGRPVSGELLEQRAKNSWPVLRRANSATHRAWLVGLRRFAL